jgi:hypothetical protein
VRTGVWRAAILCILAVVGLALILVWSGPEIAHKHKPQLHHLARQEAIKTAQNREVYWGLSQNEAGKVILYSRPTVLKEMP